MPQENIIYRPIGHVRSAVKRRRPPGDWSSELSVIELEESYVDGLVGLEAGQRLLIIFHLHLAAPGPLLQHPRGDTREALRGVFALRSPQRPNPIGSTEVELLEIRGSILRVRGLDALDGTPLLDIKPA